MFGFQRKCSETWQHIHKDVLILCKKIQNHLFTSDINWYSEAAGRDIYAQYAFIHLSYTLQ